MHLLQLISPYLFNAVAAACEDDMMCLDFINVWIVYMLHLSHLWPFLTKTHLSELWKHLGSEFLACHAITNFNLIMYLQINCTFFTKKKFILFVDWYSTYFKADLFIFALVCVCVSPAHYWNRRKMDRERDTKRNFIKYYLI